MAVYGQHSAQAFSGSDAEGRILVSVGDVTNESALIEVRDTIVARKCFSRSPTQLCYTALEAVFQFTRPAYGIAGLRLELWLY